MDLAQPELSFDMAALDGRILMAQHSWRHDQKEAAGVLRGAFEPEEKVRAAVHLMMGREAGCQWTPTGTEKAASHLCYV